MATGGSREPQFVATRSDYERIAVCINRSFAGLFLALDNDLGVVVQMTRQTLQMARALLLLESSNLIKKAVQKRITFTLNEEHRLIFIR